ncbi:putative transporter YxxF (plasmid) [Peptoclostridium acidaminophilum DSM 3953]|uniref:Putative transporter YxxF n=1 Tax=Peptoclostridium acidaminophilum DSM 3953 TaxID=1286171 RepID=W8UBQ3_PEPAC|nr:EamA family transporter [Peptoclostridium acidaminophilum]AHM58146.1 putative transporter YxxF [Peptoclostridium acidaminophilum DSM 3953]
MNNKIRVVISMLIWGSIGLLVRGINLPSMGIAFLRAVTASAFLGVLGIWMLNKDSKAAIKSNIKPLMITGLAMGFNWLFLFQAYKYTTISNATLSYYFAPVFIAVLSPLVLGEKFTAKKISSVFAAMLGLYLILSSQSAQPVETGFNHMLGIAYGLAGAAFYAVIILTSKRMKGISGFETSLVQLATAAIVMLPVTLINVGAGAILGMDMTSWLLILTLGILHTGIAYANYFSAIRDIDGQSIAVLSYIDPISAVVLASMVFGEVMTLQQILGGLLILGSTLFSQLDSFPRLKLGFSKNKNAA